jgi:hypothetical protein
MIETIYPKGMGRRARLWVDELPMNAAVPANLQRMEQVLTGVGTTGLRKFAAIETFQPRGGSFHYGLLGAELMADATGTLLIVVPTESPVPSIQFAESLAGDLDEVVIGGGPEYATAIISALQKTPRRLLPSGRLIFSTMAHGAVGSAPIVFSSLTEALIRLITRPELPQNADEATALLAPA